MGITPLNIWDYSNNSEQGNTRVWRFFWAPTFFGSDRDLRYLLTKRNELLPLVYPHRDSENNSLSRDNKFGKEAKLEPIGETRQRAHAGPEAIAKGYARE